MGGEPFLFGLERFFRGPITEVCACGHTINIVIPAEHTCTDKCVCPRCQEMIARQLILLEED
jgi:hypothetical protein